MKLSLKCPIFLLFLQARPALAEVCPAAVDLAPQVHSQNGTIRPLPRQATDGLRSLIRALIAAAKKGGHPTSIGWFDLDRFSEEIDLVRFCSNESDQAVLGSGIRIGSVYFTEEKTLIVNRSLLAPITLMTFDRPLSIGTDIQFLHEFLGALGYPDENYEMSLIIRAWVFPEDFSPRFFALAASILQDHLQRNSRRTKNLQFAGTSSGFGGGGDPAAAAAKFFALAYLAQSPRVAMKDFSLSHERDIDELMAKIIRLRVEPADSSSEAYTGKASSESVKIMYLNNLPVVSVDTNAALNAKDGFDITIIGKELIRAFLTLNPFHATR